MMEGSEAKTHSTFAHFHIETSSEDDLGQPNAKNKPQSDQGRVVHWVVTNRRPHHNLTEDSPEEKHRV